MSEKMLAQTLRTLERDGLLVRVSHPEVPPRVEYSLTARGSEAATLIAAIVGWAEHETMGIIASQDQHDTSR